MSRRKISMIGNTHIDVVWLWKSAEGLQEVKSSFASALERMKEFPEFKFSASSLAYFEWLKENCPEEFEEIKERVKEGRFELVGAMWTEPDCNLPSGEALIRHILYSKRFAKENFDVDIRVGYNVDSFGHGSNLPAILAGCGIDYYLCTRPDPSRLDVPPVFKWTAANGACVVTERAGGEYVAWTKTGILENLRLTEELLDRYDYDRQAVFYGVGNHGGGPTIDNIRTICELREERPDLDLDFSTMREFFDSVDAETLLEFKGELGRINMGCYSSDNEIKRLNRKAEWSLVKAEALSTIASLVNPGYQVPKKSFARAWKTLLFNQFHDVLSGTCIEPARNEACDDFRYSISIARRLASDAIQGIAGSLDTRGEGFPLLLLNPTGKDYKGVYCADVYCPSSKRKQVRMRRPDGAEIPYAETAYRCYAPDARKGILFEAEVPAYGYAVYRVLQEGPNIPMPESTMAQAGNTISNGIVTVVIDETTGAPRSVKKGGKELLAAPAAFRVFRDHRGAWGVTPRKDELLGEFTAQECKLVELNAMRLVYRSILNYEHSQLIADYVLERGSDLIRMNCTLYNRERHTEICYCVPVAGEEIVPTTETAFLAEERVIADGTEFYQHRFADVHAAGGEGIAIFNDSAYGMCQSGREYRAILSRSAVFARGHETPIEVEADRRYMDQSSWEFTLLMLPHDEAVSKERLFTEADFLHMPVEYLGDSCHTGRYWLRQDQCVKVTGDGVMTSSVKYLESEDGFLVRFYECEGKETEAIVNWKTKDGSSEYACRMNPYEIKTIKITSGTAEECDMIENGLR